MQAIIYSGTTCCCQHCCGEFVGHHFQTPVSNHHVLEGMIQNHDFPTCFQKTFIPTVLRHPFLRSLGIDNIKIVVPIIAGAKPTNPCPSGCWEERSSRRPGRWRAVQSLVVIADQRPEAMGLSYRWGRWTTCKINPDVWWKNISQKRNSILYDFNY